MSAGKASLYMRYLVADQISKRMESVGAKPGTVFFLNDDDVHIGLAYEWGHGGAWDTPESREAIVADFLAKYPDAGLTRERNYADKPEMTVRGETHLGIKWQIDFREGVCERVQVGTKTVEKYDSDALLAIPKVIVEEPVFEWMCPDPLRAAVQS